jgi:hypothetical protein
MTALKRVPADVAAKRAEIARRYDRKWKQQPLPDRLAAVGRAEVRRFFQHETGGKLSSVALNRHIIDTLGEGWERCSKVELAHRMGLTLDKRMRLDLRRYPAIDVTPGQAKAAYRARRKWKDGNRKRELRSRKMEAIAMSADLSLRQESLFLLLRASGKQMNVAEIAKAVKDFPAWRCPDGSRMTLESLTRNIRKELDSLEADGSIKQERRPTKYGFKRVIKTSVVARKTTTASADARTEICPHTVDPHKTGTSYACPKKPTRVRTGFLYCADIDCRSISKRSADDAACLTHDALAGRSR